MRRPRVSADQVLGLLLATALTAGSGLLVAVGCGWLANDSPWNPGPSPAGAGWAAVGLGTLTALCAGRWLFAALAPPADD